MQPPGQISGNGSPYRPWLLQQPPTPPPAPDVRGRHRKRAELSRLTQEIRALQDELRELERAPAASVGCRELVRFIESCPDPFVPKSWEQRLAKMVREKQKIREVLGLSAGLEFSSGKCSEEAADCNMGIQLGI